MKYYKYSELVRNYSVSDKTVRNWVSASLQGKVDLKLQEVKGKYYIADSAANNVALESLAQSGKKYRNSRSAKTVEPKQDFYRLFTPYQMADMANELEKNAELPWHYTYFGQAAELWDEHLKELHSAGKNNLVTNTIDALKLNFPYLEALTAQYERINVINVCSSNNLALHDLLSRIRAGGKLGRFIAVDTSNAMLDMAEHNVERWYGGNVAMERRQLDIRNQPVNLYDVESVVEASTANSINLFFLVGGALKHFDYPQRVLQTINASMSKHDLLITTSKRDGSACSLFDLNAKADAKARSANAMYLLDLLGVDESFCEIEQTYDKAQSQSHLSAVLNVNVTIHFVVAGVEKEVMLEKGERILLWRSHAYSDEQLTHLLVDSGFDQLLTAQTMDQQALLTVSRPKKMAS